MSAATILKGPDSAIAPSLDQGVDQARVGERRRVAERPIIVLGDLAQDAPHDLARAGLGQAGGEMEMVGRRDRPDLLPDVEAKLLLERLAMPLAGDQGDVGVDALALDVV